MSCRHSNCMTISTHRITAGFTLLAIFGACGIVLAQAPVDNHFTYQGLIKQNGMPFNGSCNFSFSLYAVPTSGAALGTAFNAPGIAVANGLFTVQLEFAANAFNGEKRWLEIQAQCPAGSGSMTALSPRQELTASPYAAYSMQAPWGGLTGMPSGFADGVDNDTQYTAGTGLILSSGQFSVDFGNVQHRVAGCPGGGFIQGIDANGSPTCGNAAAVAHMHSRIEADANGSLQIISSGASTTPNIVGGYSGNSVYAGNAGVTISGGGSLGNHCGPSNDQPCSNRSGDDYATVGGGYGNYASYIATVGGGASNMAGNSRATVGGGDQNTANGQSSTVGGGTLNTAGGDNSTIPGGYRNNAAGTASFAAGNQAKAYAPGCFVWGDSTASDVICSDNNRWVARASGGVYLYTNSGLTSGMYLAAGGSSWNAVSNRSLKDNFQPLNHRELLARVGRMSIGTWNYKAQAKSIRHIGPMADEFNALIPGLGGEGNDHINSLDADGVAIAAIQGLYQELMDRDAKIASLEARLAELEQVLRQMAAAQKER